MHPRLHWGQERELRPVPVQPPHQGLVQVDRVRRDFAVRRWPLPLQLRQVAWIDRLHDSKVGVPYGIALAAAALLLYPGSIIFQRLVG